MKKAVRTLLLALALSVVFATVLASVCLADYTSKVQAFINDYRFCNGAAYGDRRSYHNPNADPKQCAAYTYDFAWEVWGVEGYAHYGWNDFWAESEIQDGDVIIIRTVNGENEYTHFYVVLDVRDNGTFWTAEANVGNGYVRISDSVYSYTNTHPGYAEFRCGFHNPYYEPYSPRMPLDMTDAKQTYLLPSSDSNLVLTVDTNINNVYLDTKTNSAAQIWNFEKQDDESYIITSLYNGWVLDVDGAGTTNGTNIQVYPRSEGVNNAQRWYVYWGRNGNQFVPKNAPYKCLDVLNASMTVGTNIQLWEPNNSSAQDFSATYCNDLVLPQSVSVSQTELSLRPGETANLTASVTPSNVTAELRAVNFGSSDDQVATVSDSGVITAVSEGTATVTARSAFNPSLSASCIVTVENALVKPVFTALTVSGHTVHMEWTPSPLIAEDDVRTYSVLIYPKENLTDLIWVDWNIEGTSCDASISEHGEYTAYVWAANKPQNLYSDYSARDFYVFDGDWLYTDTLPEDLADCEVEYLNHYDDRESAESPGEGWVQGECHEYYVDGSVDYDMTNPYQLPDTDTRVCIGAFYYHYCDANGYAEHYWTDRCQYETITDDLGQYNISWSGADGDDSRFTVYLLTWREGEWAGGTVTCPWGTKPFYRGFKYQNRTLNTTYTWSKESAWSTEPDPNADSYSYRIRQIQYENVLKLPADLTRIEDEAFMGNTEIQEVIVPSGCAYIGNRAFAGCTALRRVYLPLTTQVEEDAFSGCDSLTIILT